MKQFRTLNFFAIALCFVVVVFGAYVRLADAGLGCPDWPGCYGHVGIPDATHEIQAAESKYPERPVEAPKAWKEMIHRYLASGLGLVIVVMAFWSLRLRAAGAPRVLPWVLVGLVCFQGALGMWTVTLLLKPAVVTAHLLGGMTTLSLLFWLWRSTAEVRAPMVATPKLKRLAVIGLIVVAMQIFLGGWTSTNYAALACPDLPTCHGQWLPKADFKEGFTLWRGLGQNYEFGVLNNDARVAIHLTHRIGAVVVTTALALLIAALFAAGGRWRAYGYAVLAALSAQIIIGLSVVHWQLPLLLADAHNAGAAVLLLTLLAVNRAVFPVTAAVRS